MMGGSETGSRDKDGVHAASIHVPIGWQRRVEGVQVVYVSPNGTALSSLDEVKTYLLSDGTCKCGLECPLIIHKVFNFTVGVKVEQHNQPLSKAEQDMTKLCNHRRKVVAMAALCRSMQASQLPFANVHHPEPGIVVDSCNPKRTHIKGEEDGRGNCHSKPLPKPSRTQNNLYPNPVASPKSPQQFVYPYNGSSPGIHTETSSHHPLEALKRLQHPPFSLPSSSSSSSSLPAYCFSQRSQRNPPPQNVNQCHRTSKTPEIPSSPRSRLHASPPPLTTGSGGTGQPAPTHHPHKIGGSPSSRSPSLSPSVHNINASPHQRSRHPSSSPSPLSDQGGGSTPVMAGEGLLASNLRHRRKSASSSPQPPLSCSSNPNSHFPKYKLEDVLEQFKNSGNISTSNHLLISTNTFLTNQSSANPHARTLKTLKSTVSPIPSTGLHSFVSNSAAACSSPLGPFQNHHSNQSKPPLPASFPASSLLSAAAKAQLANQLNQVQGSNMANNQESVSTSTEELKETHQQQSAKVKNSTLLNSQLPSPVVHARAHHPSLASVSPVLFPTSQSMAPSLASSLPHLPFPVERSALHRKRHRRSPTTLTITRNTQQLANGPRKTPPGGAVSSSVINLSSSASPPVAHPSSTSDVLGQSTDMLENQSHPGKTLGLANMRQTAHLPRHRQNEALDFTTSHPTIPLGLDPPTQPLSALLHLLSVQNAQASASNSASALPIPSSQEDGHTNKQSANSSPASANPPSKVNSQTQSPRQPDDTTPQCLVAAQMSSPVPEFRSVHPQAQCHSANISPQHRRSPASALQPYSNVVLDCSTPSLSMTQTFPETHQQTENHIPSIDPASQGHFGSPVGNVVAGICRSSSPQYSQQPSITQDCVSMTLSTSPKPLDLSNHVLALLAVTSAVPQEEGNTCGHVVDAEMSSQGDPVPEAEEHRGMNDKDSTTENADSAPTDSSLLENNHSPPSSSEMTESTTTLHLAEAFPFMNQEQLLQLLSSMGGLPSILDPTILASLHLGGLFLCGQHAQLASNNSTPQSPQNLAEQPEHIVIQQQDVQQQNPDHQQKQPLLHNSPLFPLLPMLNNVQGELPLNLLGLLNPIPTPVSTSSTGQEGDLGLPEKQNLQALLMASLLQQQGPMLPLTGLSQLNQVNLEVPLQPPQHISTLESLNFDKASGLLDPTALPGPGLLELPPGLLPIPPGAEGSIQALQSLLFPAALPHPATFLPLNPALLTAALNSAELHPPPHPHLVTAQQTQHTQPQVHSDTGVDTLIPLSIQSKDNPILQQLLPTLLNPAFLGDPSGVTGLHNIMGIGAGSILLPPTPALGMPLLQGPDGAINLLNNIQLNLSPPSEAEKSATLQETPSPNPHEDIPAIKLSSDALPSPASTPKHTPSPPQGPGGRSVIDPYTAFMDTIYTSFLQVNAKEEEDGGDTGPSDPTSPFCALPPVPFPFKNHTPSTPAPIMPQASAPVSLSPRLACSLRNPYLSRLSLEAAAHSPAQGTPKPSEEGAITPLQRKQVMEEGHIHPDPPLPPIFFEETKTDYAGPASAACPYVEAGVDRQGHPPQSGYLQPRDSCSGIPTKEMSEMLLHREQERDDAGAVGVARRGRKRKQTLQNVLEDFRDLDAATLEETKATTALLKPERSVRGRRRRGARSQRQ
ncbi:uncharacterized protein mbd6 [Neosynchiropus ocellatus]